MRILLFTGEEWCAEEECWCCGVCAAADAERALAARLREEIVPQVSASRRLRTVTFHSMRILLTIM